MIVPRTGRAAQASSFARRRRRRGAALMAFGGAGLAILLVLAVMLIGPLQGLGSAAASLENQRARVVAMLPAAEAALRSAATTATGAGTSLRASGNSARDGSALLVQLATAMDDMSSASRVEILGSRPFGSLSDDLSGVATRSRSLAANLDVAADAIAANVTDSETAASDLGVLADEVAALHAELAASAPATADGTGALATSIAVLRLLLAALLIWLAVPAIVAIWLGWRWWRGGRRGIDIGRGINQS
jgi:hypothetical protein